MAEDWSPEEVAATVADYMVMLGHELRGESYNKSQHNRRLQPFLHGRTKQAIEFKHANISAVLIELGFPYIEGYKPRGNYQDLLRVEVSARLDSTPQLQVVAKNIVEAAAPPVSALGELSDVLVPPPVRERERTRSYERRQPTQVASRNINYLEREARNASLGLAGELFALAVEHQRLWEAGHKKLAERLDHVSQTQGDGLGYDILSFEPDGRERLIEVKTTSFGSMTPFFASKREVNLSEDRAVNFNVYRVFKFREAPQLFMLPGSLKESCILDVVEYRASLP